MDRCPTRQAELTGDRCLECLTREIIELDMRNRELKEEIAALKSGRLEFLRQKLHL